MNRLRRHLLALVLVLALVLILPGHGLAAGPNTNASTGSAPSSTTSSSGTSCSKNNLFFFIPPWYEYLNLDANCTPQVNSLTDIYPIGLAVLEMLLRIAGFAAVISIIISGVMYVTSAGNSETASKALSRLYNSLIGMAIAFVAAGFVAFIGNKLQ